MWNLPQSREPWWAPGTDSGFHRRCASALTHPFTVVALATLLLNDLVLKAIWPDAWVTGKLSDLAWVVFALPLLAFLLSLITRGSVTAARAAFLMAYAGLPLLYAAFNTFEPVHYWILRGIAVASGGMGRTPLDATDSIVIPLGWAVAVWVWRRPALSPDALRLRLGLLVAGVAILASVATSYPDPDYGIESVGVSADGIVYAAGSYSTQISDDGGITWAKESGDRSVVWGSDSVMTPRGRYTVEGTDISLITADGMAEIVYSTAYLSRAGNTWAQEKSTAHLDVRKITTRPGRITYHAQSGNLIIAMGIQGVLVGTPDEQWMPRAVGRYAPTDFTILGKTRLLLSDISFLVAALSLSMSMTGAGVIFLQNSHGIVRALLCALLGSLGLMMFSSGVMLLVSYNPIVYGGLTVLGIVSLLLAGLSAGLGWRPLVLTVALPVAIVLALHYFGILPFGSFLIPPLILMGVIVSSIRRRDSRAFWTIAVALVIPALVSSVALLMIFGGQDPEDIDGLSYGFWILLTGIAAATFGPASLLMSLRLRLWKATITSLAGMSALILLVFLLWLHLGIPLALVKGAALILTGIAAFRLLGYVRRQTREYPAP